MPAKNTRPFDGRVIFDHQPKTAGQAVNAWLREVLGTQVVTDNLLGSHRELIARLGGIYSVISGHIAFSGEGLDPRYRYLTCLRDPVDRAASWIFFVLNNHTAEQLPGLYEEIERIVNTEGREVAPEVLGTISNLYVRHFAGVRTGRLGELGDVGWLKRLLKRSGSTTWWVFSTIYPNSPVKWPACWA